MIFDTAFLISYLSRFVTLEPGDVILTGTHEWVIAGMKEPVWLRDGDVVTMEVTGLGRLENRFTEGAR
jgi:2-keto-4-pentenoate hydratase/2-oxohepta-3-ene-1,7-dioic acid hydratase in catechol pathway